MIRTLLATFLAFAVSAIEPWTGCKLEGTGGKALPYAVEPVFPEINWDDPLAMAPVPGFPGHYVIVQQLGQFWALTPEGKRNSFLKVQARAMNALFHPDFPATPCVFLRYSSQGINRVIRYSVSSTPPFVADSASALPILEWKSVGHRGGDLAFGPDGCLYIASGDGEKWGDPHNTAQDTSTLKASILRIDLRSPQPGKTYRIPPDNPFVGIKGVRPEIWAYGVRNPWRFTFRPGTNELWAGDNGDETWEMVLKIERGNNHGWSAYEGSHVFRTTNTLKGPTQVHTPPVVEHNHQEMRSIIGGRWYRGEAFPELRDHYVYGGHVTGRLWAFRMESDSPTTAREIGDVGGQIVSFAEDPDGELLIVAMNRGLFRLRRANPAPTTPIPALLSETGLFANTAKHEAAPGLLPYSVNLPVHWDGATSQRYLAVPKGETIRIRHAHRRKELMPPTRSRVGLDRWLLPPGSVVMQTLSLGERRVETQISLNDREVWRFLSYRWRADQSDADLVPASGAEFAIGNQRWRIPSRAECAVCHTHVSGFVPGLNLAQVNRDNQVARFVEAGFLPKGYRPPPASLVMARPDDESQSLEDRARSYLHVNCAHCHRETGIGGRAQFQLLAWMPNADTGVIDTKPLVGMPDADPTHTRIVAPGAPEHSELLQRMAIEGPGRMPLIGSQRVDPAGVELIRRWIESLKP